MLKGNQAATKSSQSSDLESPLVPAAFIQDTREEASHGGFQYLHCTRPVSLAASDHPGNIENFAQNVSRYICLVFMQSVKYRVTYGIYGNTS